LSSATLRDIRAAAARFRGRYSRRRILDDGMTSEQSQYPVSTVTLHS
jgi:hypothetical protein